MDLESDEFSTILKDNADFFAKIAANGCDLTKVVEIEFECEFPTKDAAIAARTEMRALGGLPPPNGFFITADYTAQGGQCSLLLSVPMVPDNRVVSELEARLKTVSVALGGDFSGWEFKEA